MSKVLIYSQEDLDLILELKKEKNEELQQENEKLKADYGTKVQVERDLLKEENKILKENAENNDKVVDKVNWENQLLKKENKQLKEEYNKIQKAYESTFSDYQQLKDLIDTILNFSFFKEECPLNFGFENSTNEDKSQSIFYEDEWCENNCNDNYKDCWLKYFKKLQELEGSDSNEI